MPDNNGDDEHAEEPNKNIMGMGYCQLAEGCSLCIRPSQTYVQGKMNSTHFPMILKNSSRSAQSGLFMGES